MKRKHRLSAAVTMLMLTILACSDSASGPTNAIPSSSNSKTISNGSGGSISIQCTNFGGNPVQGSVDILAHSFPDSQKNFQISCITDSDANYLDRLVKNETGQTNQALGAITLDPSPYDFTLNPIITVPLFRPRPDLANSTQDVYYYAPQVSQQLQKISQALIDQAGRTASGRVAHFSTFVLVGPSRDPLLTPVATRSPPVVTVTPSAPITVTPSSIPVSCSDRLGCVIYKPGEAVRIAALLAYGARGSTGTMAEAASDGVYDAVYEYNNIFGHPIDITELDESCSTRIATNAARQIEADGGFIGVVGTTCSDSAIAAMDIFWSAGYTMISPSNRRTSLSQRGWHQAGYFRVSPPDSVEAGPMADYAGERDWNYVAIVYEDGTDYSTMADLFAQAISSVGGEIVARDRISSSTTDFDFIFSKYYSYSESLDAIYLSMSPLQASRFISQASSNEIYAQMLGPSILRDPVVSYSYGTSPDGIKVGLYVTDIDPSLLDYARDYGYDAAAILLEAIRDAGKVLHDGGLLIGRQALRDAVSDTYGYRGRTGTLFCNSYGDCANPKIVVYWYDDKQGEFVEVYVEYPR